jgi:FkbH-like protein
MMRASDASMPPEPRQIKCVIWDLDDTVWEGVLLEQGGKVLRPQVADVVRELDRRGVLQSIASRNDLDAALARLRELGLADYFLVPQIGWGAKSRAVAAIAEALNLGLDAFAFVDDQPFEREEVASVHPQVLVLDAAQVPALLTMPELMPRFVTEDSKNRRRMYQADVARKEAREAFDGPEESFLAGLNLRFTIARAEPGDLERAEELTVRTHQLNATGRTYSYEELDAFRRSSQHVLLIASLQDRFDSYGKIGLALVEQHPEVWTLKLLLMSCRVMSRGVGSILLSHIMGLARAARVRLDAEFVPTDRNRAMYVTFKFAGFRERTVVGGIQLLEHELATIPQPPSYVELVVG